MKKCGMKKRFVSSINRERKTDFHNVVMYEMNIDFRESGRKRNENVMLLEEDYNMIRERGYYLC